MKFFRSLGMLALVLCSSGLSAEALFKFDGKSYDEKELPASAKQKYHEITVQNYRQMEALAHDTILDLHFAEVAKSKKISIEEAEAQALEVKKPTEGDIKKFYEENKARIPPNFTFEQVKPEIEKLLVQEKQREVRQKLLEKVKSSKKFEFLRKEPVAPKIDIKTADFFRKGKKGAKVQIVEFADYQCPHCGAAFAEVKKFIDKYGDKVELVYIDFPINHSGISTKVAEGAYCAGQQDKYWPFHEMSFKNQHSLSNDSPVKFAKDLKLDVKKFETCLKSAQAKAFVTQSKEEGQRVGVSGTPTFFINGQRFMESASYEGFKNAVEKRL